VPSRQQRPQNKGHYSGFYNGGIVPEKSGEAPSFVFLEEPGAGGVQDALTVPPYHPEDPDERQTLLVGNRVFSFRAGEGRGWAARGPWESEGDFHIRRGRFGEVLRQHGHRFLGGQVVRFDRFPITAIRAIPFALEILQMPTAMLAIH
jgi:hypothetical protein